MKHISIIIPHGHTSVVNIEGTHQIFNEINSVMKGMGKPPLVKVQLVGISKETSLLIRAQNLLSMHDKT